MTDIDRTLGWEFREAAIWRLRDTAHQLDALVHPSGAPALADHTDAESLRAHAQRLVDWLLVNDEHIPADFRDEFVAAAAAASRAAYAGEGAERGTGRYAAAKRCQRHCDSLCKGLFDMADVTATGGDEPVWGLKLMLQSQHRHLVEWLANEFLRTKHGQLEFLQEQFGLADEEPTFTAWIEAAAVEAMRQLSGDQE